MEQIGRKTCRICRMKLSPTYKAFGICPYCVGEIEHKEKELKIPSPTYGRQNGGRKRK